MLVHGWGRYPSTHACLSDVPKVSNAAEELANLISRGNVIARGSGRSYGDSAIAETIVITRNLDSFISFDSNTGLLICESGVKLSDILKISVPRGWFLPVLPGTKYPTVGGAISSDVHGKNHHVDGCFSDHVVSFDLLTADGKIITCSHNKNVSHFRATCGGMGLTGIILRAKLKLRKLTSTSIIENTVVAGNLDEIFDLFEVYNNYTYSVAWLDCMARGADLGRSLLFLGEHDEDEVRESVYPRSITIPFSSPGFLLNRFSMSAFNSLFYSFKKKQSGERRIHYDSYFFPLDRINHWNRLYGSRGFLQYQFVVPTDPARDVIREILEKTTSAGKGSFLSVLKKFGKVNKNFLSFPMEGYTLALDFKYEKSLLPLLDEIDQIVVANGGRVYLAKDARMSESIFKTGYPRWQEFLDVKNEIDPSGLFASLQSYRIGL